MSKQLLNVRDVMAALEVSESKAYGIIKQLNSELSAKGYIVIPGKVSRAYFEENLQKIIQTREWAKKELAGMGFELTDSRANFLFVRHPKYSGKDLFEFLKKQKIYVRFWGSKRIEDYLRITVGTREEMETLFTALKKYMEER